MSAPAADCAAIECEGVMACARCGLQWPADAAAPGCAPITFDMLRERMRAECSRAEISLLAMLGLTSKGLPTDGGAKARRRLAELEAVGLLVERVAGDVAIKQRLNRKT